MSSARPLFVRGSGSKGMRLRWRIEVCLGLLLSRTCRLEEGEDAEVPLNIQDLWVVFKKQLARMCMVLGWRMRTGVVRTRIWIGWVTLLVAPLLTFGPKRPRLLP